MKAQYTVQPIFSRPY